MTLNVSGFLGAAVWHNTYNSRRVASISRHVVLIPSPNDGRCCSPNKVLVRFKSDLTTCWIKCVTSDYLTGCIFGIDLGFLAYGTIYYKA